MEIDIFVGVLAALAFQRFPQLFGLSGQHRQALRIGVGYHGLAGRQRVADRFEFGFGLGFLLLGSVQGVVQPLQSGVGFVIGALQRDDVVLATEGFDAAALVLLPVRRCNSALMSAVALSLISAMYSLRVCW